MLECELFCGKQGIVWKPVASVMAIAGIELARDMLSVVVSFTAVCIWLRVMEQGYAAEEGKITHLMLEY